MPGEDVVVSVGMDLQCPDVGCTLRDNEVRYFSEKIDSKDIFQMGLINNSLVFTLSKIIWLRY